MYNFPKGELVYGPDQISALIHQDPDIAQQFTLGDQAGSSVARGKMIILPISQIHLSGKDTGIAAHYHERRPNCSDGNVS